MENIIALYHNLVFRCWRIRSSKPISGSNAFGHIESSFIEVFNGDENQFIKKYKKYYPNCSVQVFKGKKPLYRKARMSIEKLIDKDKLLQISMRDQKINSIINDSSCTTPNSPKTY